MTTAKRRSGHVQAGHRASKTPFRAPTPCLMRKAKRGCSLSREHLRPGVVVEPGMRRSSLLWNREVLELASARAAGLYREGESPQADDARLQEVRISHNSDEIGEQSCDDSGGVGGAKGRYKGKRGHDYHAPDTESGKRVKRPCPCTETCQGAAQAAFHGTHASSHGRSTAAVVLLAQTECGSRG